MTKEIIADRFKNLQDKICAHLESLDGQGKFRQDLWERPGGGGGRTRIITGHHIEKGGVNFSAVKGDMPEKIYKALSVFCYWSIYSLASQESTCTYYSYECPIL